MAEHEEDERRSGSSELPAHLTRADRIESNRYAELKPQAAPTFSEPAANEAHTPPEAYRASRSEEADRLAKNAADRLRQENGQTQANVRNQTAVAENSAIAEAETRKQAADLSKIAAKENTQALLEQTNELRSVRSRFETFDQKPFDLLEEKKFERDIRSGTEQGDSYFRKSHTQQLGEDPFETLERAATSAYAAFSRDQNHFDARIASERNLDARHSLEQQKDIHAANYLAATSHRIADQIEIVTGSVNTEDGAKFRSQAEAYEAQSEKIHNRYSQRTGRTVVTDEQTIARENEAAIRVRESSSGNTRADVPVESSRHDDDTGEAVVEMTDSKREKQGRTSRGEGHAGDRQWARVDQPTRPTGRDSSGR